ncbi:unnamed protein product, partial [marine sediment metagenome]
MAYVPIKKRPWASGAGVIKGDLRAGDRVEQWLSESRRDQTPFRVVVRGKHLHIMT